MGYAMDPAESAAILVLAFSFLFWYASKQKRCWYRRYMLPLMVASFALVFPSTVAKIVVLVSAFLVYYGFRGYGKEKAKASKEGKK